jgi:hypothetical protein
MEVYTFPEDDSCSVLTADLCEHFGGCLKCPGFRTKTQVKQCFARIGVIARLVQRAKGKTGSSEVASPSSMPRGPQSKPPASFHLLTFRWCGQAGFESL